MPVGVLVELLDALGVGGSIAVAAVLLVVAFQSRHILNVFQRIQLWGQMAVVAAVGLAVLLMLGIIEGVDIGRAQELLGAGIDVALGVVG